MEIVFLGTSAGVPNKERNHTAILLIYNGQHLLFDCGEGTQRQLVIAGISPLRINKIFITHLHADHVLGLSGLLQTLAMKDYRGELEIYGPKTIKSYIEAIARFFPIIKQLKLNIKEIEKSRQVFDFKDFFIEAVSLEHVTDVYGYSFNEKDKVKIKKSIVRLFGGPSPLFKLLKEGKTIEFKGRKIKPEEATYRKKGKKISIILDTKNCKNIVQLAKNSDLLIIECVYNKEMQKLAKEYKHLTTSDVANIIKATKPKKVFITHISERFEKREMEILKEIKKEKPGSRVFLARDFMRVAV